MSMEAPALGQSHTSPAKAGFSSQRLERLHDGMKAYVDERKHSGIITLVARRGKVVDWQTWGYRDIDKAAPMERDTICRIYSMTKLVTTVAALILFEEGRIALDDPVSNYLPEFADVKVLLGGTAESPALEAPKRPMTIKHLLTHTSGMTYEFLGNELVHQLYQRAQLWECDSLKGFVERVAQLPLKHHPGEEWSYGVSLDVVGYLIEVVSGQSFERFLQERVFEPLEMKDTGFSVPLEKRERLAKLYEHGPDGNLRPAVAILGALAEPGKGFPSGGGGLFSTAGDYFRFAQMLLDGGRFGKRQILGRKTVEYMMVNHIADLKSPTVTWNSSEGFGLGGAVRINLHAGHGLGSIGQFGWYGAATTYCNIDPREGTVAILLAQHLPFNEHRVFEKFSTLFYQALLDD